MSYRARLRKFQPPLNSGNALDVLTEFFNNDLQRELIALEKSLGSQTLPVQTSPLTTRGDLYTNDGSVDTRLGVGSDGQVLTADSTQSTGIKWAAGGGGSAGIRSKPVAVTAGANQPITFTSALTSGWVLVSCWMVLANGSVADLRNEVSSMTTTDFKVNIPENGTLYYMAVNQQ